MKRRDFLKLASFGAMLPFVPSLVAAAKPQPKTKEGWFTTGFPSLDEALGGGIKPGTITTVMGRCGSGKTLINKHILQANTVGKYYDEFYAYMPVGSVSGMLLLADERHTLKFNGYYILGYKEMHVNQWVADVYRASNDDGTLAPRAMAIHCGLQNIIGWLNDNHCSLVLEHQLSRNSRPWDNAVVSEMPTPMAFYSSAILRISHTEIAHNGEVHLELDIKKNRFTGEKGPVKVSLYAPLCKEYKTRSVATI
jgi:hypothetical protein